MAVVPDRLDQIVDDVVAQAHISRDLLLPEEIQYLREHALKKPLRTVHIWSLGVGSVWWLRAPETVNIGKLLATVGVFLAYALALALRLRERLVGRRQALACALLFVAALLSIAPVDSSRHGPRVEKTPSSGTAAEVAPE